MPAVSLMLVVERFPGIQSWTAIERLRLDVSDQEMFDRMGEESTPLEMEIGWYFDDEGHRRISEDAFGDRLCFLTAKRVAHHLYERRESLTQWDFAVCAFMENLPAATRVVLYWD